MAATNYYTVNGRVRGEATGGVRTNYLPDAAGSVTATVDEFGSIVNQYRYKPYGNTLSKSGVGSDPRFRWLGTLSTQSTGVSWASHIAGQYFLAANLASVVGNFQAWYSRTGKHLYNRLNPSMGSSCNLRDYNSVPVPYITAEHPRKGVCGAWGLWVITFTLLGLEKLGVSKSGLIIQNIQHHYILELCEDPFDEVPEYWEAWSVCDLASYLDPDCSEPNYQDGWADAAYECVRGSVSAVGILLYFPGIDPHCIEEWPEWSTTGAAEAKGLWSSRTAPPGWTYPHHGGREATSIIDCYCIPCEEGCVDDTETGLSYMPQSRT